MFGPHGSDRKRTKREKREKTELSRKFTPSVGDDLDVVEADKVTQTTREENKRRRTLLLKKQNNTWGFTIQSYGIAHKKTQEVELLTYVDYVAYGGAAYLAGMRSGDVILSINGQNMEDTDHNLLVEFIRNCGDSMRMVVLFEDCCQKVELHLRTIKLKRVLAEKIFELRSLEQQERRVLAGMSRFDSCRSSIASSSSSLNSMWDDRRSLRPELDRCPSPLLTSAEKAKFHRESSQSPYPLSPRQLNQVGRQLSISLSEPDSLFQRSSLRFDFERSSLPVGTGAKMKDWGSYSSLRERDSLNRENRPSSLRLEPGNDSPSSFNIPHEYRLPPPGGRTRSRHKHRHRSAPDKGGSNESLEMKLFRHSLEEQHKKRFETLKESDLDEIQAALSKHQESSSETHHVVSTIPRSISDLPLSSLNHNHDNTDCDMDTSEGACGITFNSLDSSFRSDSLPISASTPEFIRNDGDWVEDDLYEGLTPEFLRSLSFMTDDDSDSDNDSLPSQDDSFSSLCDHNLNQHPNLTKLGSTSSADEAPISPLTDSSNTSSFSYSDLPCIQVEFINDEDACTKL